MIKTFSLENIDHKIAFSTLVQAGGKVAQLILGSISLRLITQYLSQEGYGIYAGISEYALFFSVVANLGIFAHMVRKMSDSPHDGQTFFDALVLRVGSAVVFFIIGMGILFAGNYDTTFLLGALLYFIALLGDFITTTCDAFLQAHYQMGRATFALLVGKVIYIIGLLFLIQDSVSHTISTFFALTIIAAWVTVLVSLYFVHKQVTWRWYIRWATLKEVLLQSLPFGLITICNSLYFRFLPDFIASQVLDKASFATFSITFKIAQVVSILSTFVMFSALPGMRQYIDARNWEKVKKLYRQLLWILTVVGLGLIIMGLLLSPLLITFLSDKKYVLSEFWFLLPLMLALAAISYLYDLVLITLFAFQQEGWLLRWEVITVLLYILCTSFTFLSSSSVAIVIIVVASIIAEFFITIIGYKKVQQLINSRF